MFYLLVWSYIVVDQRGATGRRCRHCSTSLLRTTSSTIPTKPAVETAPGTPRARSLRDFGALAVRALCHLMLPRPTYVTNKSSAH